jgi:hypothetical protein
MTLGELTDELQKYCNMGYTQEEVSVVNNSYSKKKMTVRIKVGNGITVIFSDSED